MSPHLKLWWRSPAAARHAASAGILLVLQCTKVTFRWCYGDCNDLSVKWHRCSCALAANARRTYSGMPRCGMLQPSSQRRQAIDMVVFKQTCASAFKAPDEI